MMTAGKLGNKTLEGDRWEANLSMWQVPHLGNIVPAVGTLEDPDEDRPVHIQA